MISGQEGELGRTGSGEGGAGEPKAASLEAQGMAGVGTEGEKVLDPHVARDGQEEACEERL